MKLKAWLVAIFDLKAEEETFSCQLVRAPQP